MSVLFRNLYFLISVTGGNTRMTLSNRLLAQAAFELALNAHRKANPSMFAAALPGFRTWRRRGNTRMNRRKRQCVQLHQV
jgi:hypothetical protein